MDASFFGGMYPAYPHVARVLSLSVSDRHKPMVLRSPDYLTLVRLGLFTQPDHPKSPTVRARSGRLSALAFLSVFLCKSVLYGAFVWARRALKH
jgi:hypothetical protein